MTRRAYVYFVVTFLIGVAVGGAGVYYYGWSAGKWRHPWNEDAFIHNWSRQLNLTPTQVKEFRSIINGEITQRKAIDEQKRPQIEALRHQTGQRIRGILSPQQVTKFNEIIQRHREAREKKK